MATNRKALREVIKMEYLSNISEHLTLVGEEVLRVGSNEIAIPVVDSEGNEDFLVLTFKIPTGSRDGDPYDGYAMAEDYALKVRTKAEEAKKKAEAKAKKIAKDAKARAAKANAKANDKGE